MRNIEVGRLHLQTARTLDGRQSHRLRGYIARLFESDELAHNHDLESGVCKYRYPLIQYKIVDGRAVVVAIGANATRTIEDMCCRIDRIELRGDIVHLEKSSLEIRTERLGGSPHPIHYRFATPWIGLNSKNYEKYIDANCLQQEDILRRCLIGNLLSLSKYLKYKVTEKLFVEHELETVPVKLKGQSMIGFVGNFAVNFYLPDLLGIGKSCSRGYGCCQKTATPILL